VADHRFSLEEDNPSVFGRIISGILIVAVVAVTILGGVYLGPNAISTISLKTQFFPNPFPHDRVLPASQSSPSAQVETYQETSNSASLASVSISDLQLTVLNGSRVEGEAGRVRDFLKSSGLSHVAVGNFSGTTQNGSTVHFGTGVPDALQKEFLEILKKNVSNAEIGDPLKNEPLGVEVVTGR
jgi:hypothetical protein